MSTDDIPEPGHAERDDSETSPQTGGGVPGAGSGDRVGQGEEGGRAHTPPGEHPAGDGERTDRDVGGPTVEPGGGEDGTEGGAHGTRPTEGFDAHQ
jgi:hypothetical protein